MERNDLRTVEMVRHIRDEQAALLAGKSEDEVLDFFRKAGEAAREDARQRATKRAVSKQGV